MAGRTKGVFHPSLATNHTIDQALTALLTPSGKGVKWKLSLDQDPSAPTAQVGPGRGTQMYAMHPPDADR